MTEHETSWHHAADRDDFETSPGFTMLPLLSPAHRAETLEESYRRLRRYWQMRTDDMHRFQDQITPGVPIGEIPLLCNPAYRYGAHISEAAGEIHLRADTMKAFISYAVGCMFGRYSLDVPGLILVGQGETIRDYFARVPRSSFIPSASNCIPVPSAYGSDDDACSWFRTFVACIFGVERLYENIAFLEQAIGQTLRAYFAETFFDDHVTRYGHRPVYWMLSSPNGTFQALIYMHRYTPETLTTVLTRYLRPFRDRREAYARLDRVFESETGEDDVRCDDPITELRNWERDHLEPLARRRISIDLADDVEQTYRLFEGVMKPMTGTSTG